MTRYEKSDAQLDAEAEARRRHLEPPRHDHGFDDPDAYDPPAFAPSPKPPPAASLHGLDKAIALHRELRRDDTRIERLVSRQPPTTFDYGRATWVQHEATRVGLNMSARLYRFVESAPPSEFPWHAAFRKLRYWCRAQHGVSIDGVWTPFHTGPDVPYWRGSLCHQLVRLTVIGPERQSDRFDGPLSLYEAAQVLRYDNPEPLLRQAFEYIEAQMDASREKAERRRRDDEGRGPGAVPAPVRPCYHPDCNGEPHYKAIPHPETPQHWAECPNPACKARRAA